MPYYRINNRFVLFVHIPKCAGTSLETMFKESPLCQGFGYYETGKDNLHNTLARCSPQHFHADLLTSIFRLSRFDLIFTVIREPVDRLLSEHTMKLQRGETKQYDFNRWYRDVRAQYVKDPFCCDNHIRPMKDFLFDDIQVYNLRSGVSAIWEDLTSHLSFSGFSETIPHIKPCGGDNFPRGKITRETLDRISIDYEDDFQIYEKSLVLISSGRLWTRANELF